jgi:glycosyltransferase involved in cell wall biosynthesis
MVASPLRVVVFYKGTVAPDHGSRRILEQMAWLVADGCRVSLVPVVTQGAPAPEISGAVGARGIEVLNPILVRVHSPAARAWLGLAEHPSNLRDIQRSVRNADWILEGNTIIVGLSDLARTARRRAVISWDGDAASRWHTTYVRWLVRRDPVRAARRSIFVVSACRGERYLARHRDFVTVPGPADLAALSRTGHRGTRVVVVPNVVWLRQIEGGAVVAPPRLDILFVGSAYGPNVDGLRWFLRRVWPSVRQSSPKTRLTVAGRDINVGVIYESAVSPPGVEFVGRVADLETLYRAAKVVIVPLFYGSGVPNKFLEALAANAGIVTTKYVATAVGTPDGLRSNDRPNAWSEAVLSALHDPPSARLDPAVRAGLLTTHGPAGFDVAMRAVVERVRRLRSR